jgi:hypothetical protein
MNRNELDRAQEIRAEISRLEALLTIPQQRGYRPGTLDAEHDRVMDAYRAAYRPEFGRAA